MRKYLARDHKFYVSDDNNWIQISGVASWTVSYEKETSELSKFTDNGWGGTLITARTSSINLTGFYLIDEQTKQRDFGQFVCDSAANSLGYHGLRGLKIEAFDSNNTVIGFISASGVLSSPKLGGAVTTVMPWGTTVQLKGIPLGSGIYDIFSQETYPAPAPDISRSGMWTGVLGMYTYAE